MLIVRCRLIGQRVWGTLYRCNLILNHGNNQVSSGLTVWVITIHCNKFLVKQQDKYCLFAMCERLYWLANKTLTMHFAVITFFYSVASQPGISHIGNGQGLPCCLNKNLLECGLSCFRLSYIFGINCFYKQTVPDHLSDTKRNCFKRMHE